MSQILNVLKIIFLALACMFFIFYLAIVRSGSVIIPPIVVVIPFILCIIFTIIIFIYAHKLKSRKNRGE